MNPSNVRNRLLNGAPARGTRRPTKWVVQRVKKRATEGRMLLPERVTPHTLRRTFASLCFFAGRDLRWVIGQLGHDDPRMTLGVYAQCMKRSQVDEAWSGSSCASRTSPRSGGRESTSGPHEWSYEDFEAAPEGLNPDGRGGFRTCDLSRVKRALSH